jgi:uncharacterized protein YqkB
MKAENMKNIARIAVIGALLALGIAQSNAGFVGTQTNYTTNIVVKSKLVIFGRIFLDDGGQVTLTTKVALTNIAQALDITLDKKAHFQLVHIITSTDNFGSTTALQGTWRVRLVNGATTYDLSATVGAATGPDLFNVTAADNISVSKVKGNVTVIRRILHVSFDANNLGIEGNGVTIIRSTTSAKGTAENLDCDFYGDGFVEGDTNMVIQGGLDASGKENATEVITTVTSGP